MRGTICGTWGLGNSIRRVWETAAGEALRSMAGLGAAAKVHNESTHPHDERHEKHYQACDEQRRRQMRRLHGIGSDSKPMNETEEYGQERRKGDALRLKIGERGSRSLWS